MAYGEAKIRKVVGESREGVATARQARGDDKLRISGESSARGGLHPVVIVPTESDTADNL